MNRKQRRTVKKSGKPLKSGPLQELEKAARLSNEVNQLPAQLRFALARCIVGGAVMVLSPRAGDATQIDVRFEQRYVPLPKPTTTPATGLWTPGQKG